MPHDATAKDGSQEAPDLPRDRTAGQTLRIWFRQGSMPTGVEEQTASESLLMNPSRLSLFIHLSHEPCDHARSISRKTGKSLSAVNWNLGMLAERGYMESCPVDRRVVYWPVGMVRLGDAAALSILRAPWAMEILKMLSGGSMHLRERDMLSLSSASQQGMSFRLGRLVSSGLLERAGRPSLPEYSIDKRFVELAKHYETESRQFSRTALELLRHDGLMPRKPRLRGTRFSVEVRLPGGVDRICLECNPMATARRILKSRM